MGNRNDLLLFSLNQVVLKVRGDKDWTPFLVNKELVDGKSYVIRIFRVFAFLQYC
jgi:hypothetical protein